jgi:hypothetical protein
LLPLLAERFARQRLIALAHMEGYEDWELPDPTGQSLEAVRPMRGDIEQRVRRIDGTKHLLYGLPVVADRPKLTHYSIIRSNEVLVSAPARQSDGEIVRP